MITFVTYGKTIFYHWFSILSVRGFLGSSVLFSYNLGMMLEFVLGAYFDYHTAPKIVIGITIICVISLFFFPETPSFLLKQGKIAVSNEEKLR